MLEKYSPMLVENEKKRCRDDGDRRQNHGDGKKVLSLAERVGACDQDGSRSDIQNQNPVPKRDRKRGNGKEQQDGNQQREMSSAIFARWHRFSGSKRGFATMVSAPRCRELS